MAALKRISTLAVIVSVALCAAAGVARAAVEDYVPADAVGIIKMKDPVSQFDSLTQSALFKKLEDPGYIPAVSAGIGKARQGIAGFETQLNVNVHQTLSDLLGREVALVALPDNQGVGIVEGRDAKSLQSGVDEFLRIQRVTGDLAAESSSTYKGVTIESGMQKQGERYHAIVGNVLVVGGRVEVVQKVIDVIKGAPSLGGTARYKQASAVTARGAAVTGYLNGDALQPLAQKLMAPLPGAMKPGAEIMRARLADFLQQVDYGVLGVSGSNAALQVQLTFAYKGGHIPDALRAALPEAGSRMDIQRLAPPSCVAVGVRSVNIKGAWNSTVQALASVRPEAADQLQKGLDSVVGAIGGVYSPDQLFSELGGQVGIFVLPAAQGGSFPAGALALELRNTTHIPDAVGTVAGLDAIVARSKGWDVTVENPSYHDVQLTTFHINRKGPVGQLSPTFGVVKGYLVAASTLDAAKQVVDASLSSSVPPVEAPGTPVAMLSVSVPQVRALLTRYHDFLVKQAMANEGKSQQKAESDLSALDTLLELLQKVQVTTTYEPGRTNHFLTIGLAAGR